MGTRCQQNKDRPSSPSAKIIRQAIDAAGGEKFKHSFIEFDFRDKHYGALHDDGHYEYTRTFTDSTGRIHDVLSNSRFYREIDGVKANLPDSMKTKYSNSVNSVIYFALLPDGLDDPAVISKQLGEVTLEGKRYDKIHVTFRQEGGGKDYQDEFLYWFDQEDHSMDYLAYTYAVDGGGIRFRKAINIRTVGGIRFADYINYEPADQLDFNHIDQAYQSGKLRELSRIELKNIKLSP